jgi:hypothetical protein
MRKTIGDYAAEHLRENGHDGIMWGDHILAHEIAAKAGIGHNGWRTHHNVLRACERSPHFTKKLVYLPNGRICRSFFLVKSNES